MPLSWSCVRLILTVGLTVWAGATAGAQEVMAVNQVIVFSKDSTLVSVDASGSESKSEVPADTSTNHPASVSQAGPGGKIEVSGGTAAEMIISEAVTARLEPGTQIEVPKIEEGQKPTASLKLLKGKMFIKVDAEKLKKDGNVEFRLETPKSLLAVKGTKFVAASGEEADTVALLEGSIAVRDQVTKEFGILRPEEATEIKGEGKLEVRRLNLEESKYSRVFDQAELSFVRYKIERKSVSTVKTKLGKDTGDLSADGGFVDPTYGTNGIEIRYRGYYDSPPANEVDLRVSFKPARLRIDPEEVIGLLVRVNVYVGQKPSIIEGEPTIQFKLACSESELLAASAKFKFGDFASTEFNYDQVPYRTLFVPAGLIKAASPEELQTWETELGAEFYTDPNSEPQRDRSFLLRIGSIQVITQGG